MRGSLENAKLLASLDPHQRANYFQGFPGYLHSRKWNEVPVERRDGLYRGLQSTVHEVNTGSLD